MFRAILFLLQITERYHPLALRHFLISAHYRSPLNYSIAQLETSSDAVYYIFQVSGLLCVFA
jgi:cysteinyl-tRNA synthetase